MAIVEDMAVDMAVDMAADMEAGGDTHRDAFHIIAPTPVVLVKRQPTGTNNMETKTRC